MLGCHFYYKESNSNQIQLVFSTQLNIMLAVWYKLRRRKLRKCVVHWEERGPFKQALKGTYMYERKKYSQNQYTMATVRHIL